MSKINKLEIGPEPDGTTVRLWLAMDAQGCVTLWGSNGGEKAELAKFTSDGRCASSQPTKIGFRMVNMNELLYGPIP